MCPVDMRCCCCELMSGVGPKHSSRVNLPDVTHLTLLSLDRTLVLDVFDVDAGTIHVPLLPLPNVTTMQSYYFLYSSMLRSAFSAACREVGL
jgi:hypothetical protein